MKKFLYDLGSRIQRFMVGRNGVDDLNIFIVIVYVFISLIQSLFRQQGNLLVELAKGFLLVLYLFRCFSKNLSKRRNENQKFRSMYLPVVAWIKKKWKRLKKMKDYKYFKCPNCKMELRVPRGKGNITITCPKCQTKFDRKS